MGYDEISEEHRKKLHEVFRTKTAREYPNPDALFSEYFAIHSDQLALIGTKNTTFGQLVIAIIRWHNYRTETAATTGSRVEQTGLQRY